MNNDIQEKAKKIEAVYNNYLAQLEILKKKQAAVLNDFIKELEQKKIEAIRKLIK